MPQRPILSSVFFVLILSCWRTSLATDPSLKRPNIVVALVDDMGWSDFSCFGNKEIQTTNIDRLASEGIRFEQFYVNSPICSPSRVALSTGQYPMRWRITSYLETRKKNERRGMAQWLDPQAPILARVLHDAGYATGHFGKWHMGGQRDVGDAPLITEYGFDESLTSFEGLGPRVLPLLDSYDGTEPRKYSLGSDTLGRGPIRWEKRDRITDTFTDAAIAFIDQAKASNRPFYINLWPDDVHSPFFPPKARRGDSSKHQLYLGVLKTMDEQLGRLFDHIRNDKSLCNNTLILVCSDNGPERGAGSAGHLRGGKGMLYEGGIRSPLIVWGPRYLAKGKSGATNDSSVFAAIDLVPTLMDFAHVPNAGGITFDGERLCDVLLGQSDRSRAAPLYFRRPPDRPYLPGERNLPDLALREGQGKLLCEYDGTEPQLYNLNTDPGEKKNLAIDHKKEVKRLIGPLLKWNASMPTDTGATYTALMKGNGKKRISAAQQH